MNMFVKFFIVQLFAMQCMKAVIIENKFGAGTSNPAVFGQLILEYQDVHPGESLESLTKDLRLLPSYTKFKVQLDAWAQAALKELEEKG